MSWPVCVMILHYICRWHYKIFHVLYITYSKSSQLKLKCKLLDTRANCPATSLTSRHAKRNLSCSSNGPLILPLTPETSSNGQAISSSLGRPSVVGIPSLLLEWKKPDHAVNIHDNNIRCFSSGLGSHYTMAFGPELHGPLPNNPSTLKAWNF